jgi:ABC-type sugar transport system substrate-binding protein
VQDKADAIFLAAIDTASVKDAIDEAVAADIPVYCNECESTGYEGKVVDVGENGTGTVRRWRATSSPSPMATRRRS